MATDLTKGSSSGFPCDRPRVAVVSRTLDQALAAGVAEMIHVPAGTFVLKVIATVEKADTGASTRTFSVGDGSAAAGFIVATDAKTPATVASTLALTTGTPNTVTGYSNGKFYAAADTIDLTAVQDLTDAVITVTAVLIDCNP